MKIKFEVKLTASKALLTVLSALLGLQASASAEGKTEKMDAQEALTVGAITAGTGAGPSIAETQEESRSGVTSEIPKKRRTTRTTVEQSPIPEKIVAPAPEEAGVEESVEEESPVESALTVDDIRNYAGKILQANPGLRDAVMNVLLKKGATKFSEAKAEDYADILAEFKKLG